MTVTDDPYSRQVTLMVNGIVETYLVRGPEGVLLTGMPRAWSLAYGQRMADQLGVAFVDETDRVSRL